VCTRPRDGWINSSLNGTTTTTTTTDSRRQFGRCIDSGTFRLSPLRSRVWFRLGNVSAKHTRFAIARVAVTLVVVAAPASGVAGAHDIERLDLLLGLSLRTHDPVVCAAATGFLSAAIAVVDFVIAAWARFCVLARAYGLGVAADGDGSGTEAHSVRFPLLFEPRFDTFDLDRGQ